MYYRLRYHGRDEDRKGTHARRKEDLKEIQSIRINLDITWSNAKEVYKILDDLELAYKTNKDAFSDFWLLLKPY